MAASVSVSFHARLNFPFTADIDAIRLASKSRVVFRVRKSTNVIERVESRIGRKPIEVPSDVMITMDGQDLKVKGPLGELAITYPTEVNLMREETGFLRIKKSVETRRAHQLHGLFRTLTDNMIIGVSKGFEKKLEIIGVGYRATVEERDIVLNLGFSHPVRMQIPAGLNVNLENKTRVTVRGCDKGDVGQFAASIREWRPPNPYGGKKKVHRGVKYVDEIIRHLKSKKERVNKRTGTSGNSKPNIGNGGKYAGEIKRTKKSKKSSDKDGYKFTRK